MAELLKRADQTGSYTDVVKLQRFMKSEWSDASVSKKGDPDGFFGPLTMKSLEKIAEIGPIVQLSSQNTEPLSQTVPTQVQ